MATASEIEAHQPSISNNLDQANQAEALYKLSILAQQTQQHQEAEKYLLAATQVEPESVKAWFSLGNLYQTQGNLLKAEEAYKKALTIRPLIPIYNNLGYTLHQQGKLEEAIVYYQKALELQPNCSEAQVNLGNLLYTQGKLSVEQKAYYAQLNNELGMTKKQAGDLESAISCYQKAILLQPNNSIAHQNLGVAFQAQGKLEAALHCYQQALELQPEYAEAINNLGTLFEQQGELQQALQSYQQAFKLQPEYAQAYSNLLGIVYKQHSANLWERFRQIWHSTGLLGVFVDMWQFFWMAFAGNGIFGRIATWFATCFTPPYWGRCQLARYHQQGYISPAAAVYHPNLQLGANVFIGDRVTIYQDSSGKVELGDRVHLYGDTYVQTGKKGELIIGADTHIQPRCHFCAYEVGIYIGSNVLIAPNCAFFPYDHAIAPGQLIHLQPLKSKGAIVIGDGAWLGCGVIVLQGVHIGKGAVIGAGSVVTHDIPDSAVAVGSPARVVKMRADLGK
jgi:acetyltransferase-like isoleucine patch superfamily enzyme/tetratricopeptide (TPR) repeat protein